MRKYLSGERQRKDNGPVSKNWLGRRVCCLSPFNRKIIKTTVQNNVKMQKKEKHKRPTENIY